jgi:NAD(P)-dependent dehydrogenase (short-subunit alcohol dehydrogenase family)
VKRLSDKVALITGAARGIGKATAARFHEEGARVILSDINDPDGEAAAAELGEDAAYLHLDVSSEDDWKAAFQVIKDRYGRLDILINNAGIDGYLQTRGPHDPELLDLESWRSVHAVNADGVALGCKYAIQLMKTRKSGSIVNISSRSGMVGIPRAAAYASSKASVRNHTKTVALHCALKGYNIRCNSIHPGAILTKMWDTLLGEGERREKMMRFMCHEIPLGHMGDPLDVANAALYLASDESRYVTGIELTVDGGILAGSAATPSLDE